MLILKIYLRDINGMLVQYWKDTFKNMEDFVVQLGDIFQDPQVDAYVSPANSFGYMDGGIDLAYVNHFGWELQTAVQQEIAQLPLKELLVGQALTVQTSKEAKLICAPTMRMPMPIPLHNCFLSTRAALLEAHNQGFKSIAMPGMGTLTGRINPPEASMAMHSAYISYKNLIAGEAGDDTKIVYV